MKLTLRLLDSWWVFMASVAWIAVFGAMHFWPAAAWIEVKNVSAADTSPWAPVPMAVDRTINRDFYGTWTVSVNRFGTSGWVAFCSAAGARQYRAGAELPPTLDLDWWTDGACAVLPEGRYVLDTTWHIRPELSFLPEKTVTVRSNIFEVKP